VLAAFDALQHFKRAVVAEFNLVDALELVGNAQPLADELQGHAARACRLPAAEEQALRAVQAWEGIDGVGKHGSRCVGVGKAADGPSMGTNWKFTFWPRSS